MLVVEVPAVQRCPCKSDIYYLWPFFQAVNGKVEDVQLMALHSRMKLTAGIGLGVAALALPLTVGIGAAAAAGPGTNARTAVAGDPGIINLPGVARLGTAAGSTPETVSFVLKERDEGALAAAASHGIKKFITAAQFARTYGQTAANIKALENYLAKYGIKSSPYADGIDVQTHGTVAEYNSALGVHQAMFHVPASPSSDGLAARPAQVIHAATGPASLPGSIAKYVTAVLGLSNYAGFSSQAAHVATSAHASGSSCVQLTGLPQACHLPQSFASSYGLTGVHATGKGQTLAIVTLASADPTGPSYFWSKVAKIKRTGKLSYVNVDGGAGKPSWNAGTNETDLDIEQSGALASAANVVVYQAPNTDYGFVDGFVQAASQNVAGTVSSSWGESETAILASVVNHQESAGYQAAYDEAFLEMAVQGQSNYIATGDSGAYTASRDLGSTNLSIGSPADSPFTTAAGGTTLPWTATLGNSAGKKVTVTVKSVRAWGWDYLWHALSVLNGESYYTAATKDVAGDTGGFSSFYKTPAYQVGVPGVGDFHAYEYLVPNTPKQYGPGLVLPSRWSVHGSPKLMAGQAAGREVPDISTDADPYTGYAIYVPSATAVGQPALQYGWGGTSFVAPELNGATAVIDSYLGHRTGLWNPAIYRFAIHSGSPFTPLSSASTSNDNLYYTGNPGQVYNPATGLGLPNFAKLAALFKAAGF
jgi:kumamolisin